MSERKAVARGRGRGKPKNEHSGSNRWTKLEEVQEVRQPKKEEVTEKKGFLYSPSGFPPLPKASTTVEELKESGEEDHEAQLQKDFSTLCEEVTHMYLDDDEKTDDPSVQVCNESLKTICKDNVENKKEENVSPSQNREKLTLENDDTTGLDEKDDTDKTQQGDIQVTSPPANSESCVPVVSTLSPYAQEFVPRNNTTRTRNSCEGYENYAHHDEVVETMSFCHSKLSENPALFDEMMEIICPHVINYLKNIQMTNTILDRLYSFCLTDPPFTYSAVRILICMFQLENSHHGTTLLRNKTLQLAQNEASLLIEERCVTPEIDHSCIMPSILFISDLYTKLFIGGKRLEVIGQAAIEVLDKLVIATHIPLKERLDIIIKVLKLTGVDLDRDNAQILDVFMVTFDAFVEQERENIDDATFYSAKSIIDLRSSNWGNPSVVNQTGYMAERQAQMYGYAIPPYDDEDYDNEDTVYYGPDGHVIPNEELLFLDSYAAPYHQHVTADQHGAAGMDEEMEDAYEDFLLNIPLTSRDSNEDSTKEQ